MAEINDSRQLPKSWVWATINDLALNPTSDIVDGPFGSNLKATEYVQEGIPIFRLQNIERNKFREKNIKFVTESKAEQLKRHSCQPRDILITKLGDPLGKACIAPDYIQKAIIVADLVRLRIRHEQLVREYLVYGINSESVIGQFESATKGTTRPRVNLSHVRDLKIPLAPLSEQYRIVAKIEELFTKLDTGVEALRTARAQLRRYRQAVLKAAVTGELTKEWRAAHQGELEPASELLARILRERRGRWEADQLAKMKAAGKKPKGDEWTKGFSGLTSPEVLGLPQIDGWCWVTLETVADAVDPQPSHRTPPEVTAGIPYVGMGDVTKDKKIDLVNARKVSPTVLEEHRQRYQLKEGDFFIGKIGTIGKPVKLTLPFVYALSANIVLIQPKSAHTEDKFAFIYMASPLVEKFLAAGSRATTQAAFGIQKVRLLPYPLPSLAEQQQIVSEVEHLLSIADATERAIEQSLKQAERLRQSILKQAFEGKLVPQDTADEPAGVLLARIREERAKGDAARPKKGKPRGGRKAGGEQIELLKGAAS